MKLAVVVQRYGQTINGGAELHARYVAEHLARHADVDVLTTCATDYVSWRNELPATVEQVHGITVRRFPVKHERDPRVFGRRSDRVFKSVHSLADELAWIDAEGPASTRLVAYLAHHARDYDHCIFFSYRYYHAYHGIRAAASRSILVPTAERDPAIGLAIFQPIFRSVRAVMYNSHEERRMIRAVSGNHDVLGVVSGIGSEIAANPQAVRFREKFAVQGPFAVYVGRVDTNKGCNELFDFFQGYLRDSSGKLSLILIGNSLLPVPSHPRIRHLGFLDDRDKFDAIAAADLLIMPSYFESLSMVALEAWALGRPVLANGRCEVLKGQCLRSNAGLYYESYSEFLEALLALEHNGWLRTALGRNGRQFFKENYDWPVIERKYLEMFKQLAELRSGRPLEPLPGWFERRRQTLPAAETVLAGLPSGPALEAWQPRADAAPEPEPGAASERRVIATDQERGRRGGGAPRHSFPRRGSGGRRRGGGPR